METKTLIVKGMKCANCKTAVESSLRLIPGIKDITIDLQNQEVSIVAESIDLKTIQSTIEGLGYLYAGPK